MVSSAVYPGLERHPGGPDNWVERAKGLPKYIERIAKHLHYEQGFSISHAIATAKNTVERWARGGTVTKHGTTKRVSPSTIAKAQKALAEWNAKRIAGRLHLAEFPWVYIDLSQELPDGVAFDLLGVFQKPYTSAGESSRATIGPNIAVEEDSSKVDLAVPAFKLTADKRRGYAAKGQAMGDGSFPIFDKQSLKSAIHLARTPAQRMHVCNRAKSLGLLSLIPEDWRKAHADYAETVQKVLDLASTIAPRNPAGKATDGRRRYKRQGKWGHGFVPLDRAAKESKAKGSPIAIKRLNRLYKTGVRTQGAGVGRAGQRSAGGRKDDTQTPAIDEKGVKEKAQSVGMLRNAKFDPSVTRKQSVKGEVGKEASKHTRIPKRARQNWDEIPNNLKTTRNGKRYVLAVFGGKNVLTEWVGGVNQVSNNPNQGHNYRSIAPQELKKLTENAIRKMLKNPRTVGPVRKQLNAELRHRKQEAERRG